MVELKSWWDIAGDECNVGKNILGGEYIKQGQKLRM